jgi:hypothetical protein
MSHITGHSASRIGRFPTSPDRRGILTSVPPTSVILFTASDTTSLHLGGAVRWGAADAPTPDLTPV